MSETVLISPDPEVLARWSQAFPSACCCNSVAQAGANDSVFKAAWLHLPGSETEAYALLAQARQQLPEARVVALSDTPSDEQALALMERGAVGYCHSHAGAAMLQQVATVVGNEGLWVGPNLLSRMIRASMASMQPLPGHPPQLSGLSVRELEVARAVAQGSNNKEIARQLSITERTVKAHLSAIFLKLGVRDRLHLALVMRTAGN